MVEIITSYRYWQKSSFLMIHFGLIKCSFLYTSLRSYNLITWYFIPWTHQQFFFLNIWNLICIRNTSKKNFALVKRKKYCLPPPFGCCRVGWNTSKVTVAPSSMVNSFLSLRSCTFWFRLRTPHTSVWICPFLPHNNDGM